MHSLQRLAVSRRTFGSALAIALAAWAAVATEPEAAPVTLPGLAAPALQVANCVRCPPKVVAEAAVDGMARMFV